METDLLEKDIEKGISERDQYESSILEGEQVGSLARAQGEDSAMVARFLILVLHITVQCQVVCLPYSVFALEFLFNRQLSSRLHKKRKRARFHNKDNRKTDGGAGFDNKGV